MSSSTVLHSWAGQFLQSNPLYFLPGDISLAARGPGTGGGVVSYHLIPFLGSFLRGDFFFFYFTDLLMYNGHISLPLVQ